MPKMKVLIVAKSLEFPLELGSQEPVSEIKRRLEHLLKIPIASQTLLIYGWELIDGLDMEDYPIITEGSKITLVTNHVHSFPIEIESGFNGQYHHGQPISNQFLDHLIEIQRSRLKQPTYSLYSSEWLDFNSTVQKLADYELPTDSCPLDSSKIETRIKIQIIVKFTTRQIVIEIDKAETILSLKEKIHIMEGTPIKRMTLFFSGTELLEDYRDLSEYGVSEFSEIIVLLKPMSRLRDEPPSKRINVVVQTPASLLNAACIPITDVKDSSTISEMREMLLARKILPVDDYLFIHKQRIMRENCSLRRHGVENGDFLYVFKGTVSRGGF